MPRAREIVSRFNSGHESTRYPATDPLECTSTIPAEPGQWHRCKRLNGHSGRCLCVLSGCRVSWTRVAERVGSEW